MIPFCFSAARHLRGWTEPGRRYPLGLRTCNLWPRRAAEKQKQGGRVAVLQTCNPNGGLTWTAGPKAEKLFHSKQRRTVSWGFLLIFSQLLREYEPAFAAFDFTPRLHEPRLTDQHHRSVSPPASFSAPRTTHHASPTTSHLTRQQLLHRTPAQLEEPPNGVFDQIVGAGRAGSDADGHLAHRQPVG